MFTKEQLENAIKNQNEELLDKTLEERADNYINSQKPQDRAKLVRFRPAMIAAATILLIGAVMIPLLIVFGKAPDPIELPTTKTSETDSPSSLAVETPSAKTTDLPPTSDGTPATNTGDPTTEPSTETPTENTDDPTTEPSTETPTENTDDPTTEPSTETPTENTDDPSTNTPTEPPSTPTDDPTTGTDTPYEEFVEYHGMTFQLAKNKKSYTLVGVDSPEAVSDLPGMLYGLPVTKIALTPEHANLGGNDDVFVLYLSENVQTIDVMLFSFVSSERLVITVDENNPYFCMDGGCLIEKSTNKLCKATIYFSYIPDYVKSIGENAFCSLPRLISITIPESVKQIGSSAFSGCGRLIEVCNLSSLDIKAGRPENGLVAWYAKHVCRSVDEIEFFSVGGDYIFDQTEDGLYLVGYFGDDTDPVLPILEGHPTYAINRSAFAENENIVSVTIPEGVTAIGSEAFLRCTSLAEITIPKSVRQIDSAFGGCERLHTVRYSGSLGDWLKFRFEVGNTPCYYGANLYIEGELLQEAVVPEGTEQIPFYAFYGCICLHNVKLPESLRAIGVYAFANTGLTKITLPEGLVSIGSLAFVGCNQLAEVCNLSTLNIEAGIELNGYVGYYAKHVCNNEEDFCQFTVGDFVFYPDNGIDLLVGYIGSDRNVVFPDSCKGESYVINDGAFAANPLIKNLTIPGASRIGYKAFAYCSELESVVISGEDVTIEKEAFSHCKKLLSVTLEEGVTVIRSQAFEVCMALETLSLPGSLRVLESNAFFNCPSLTQTEKDGLLYLGGKNDLYLVLIGVTDDQITSVVISEGVRFIASETLKDLKHLESVVFPNSLLNIGSGTFMYCKSLRSVVLPAGMKTIESDLFSHCSSLTSVTLPTKLEEIKACAFYACTSLKEIVLPQGLHVIGESAFEECTALSRITLPDSLVEIGASAFAGCPIKSLVWPAGVRVVNDSVFLGCALLEYVSLPEGVSEIRNGAFDCCTALKTLVLPKSLTHLDASVFFDCENLEKICYRGSEEDWTKLDPSGEIRSSAGAEIVCNYTED